MIPTKKQLTKPPNTTKFSLLSSCFLTDPSPKHYQPPYRKWTSNICNSLRNFTDIETNRQKNRQTNLRGHCYGNMLRQRKPGFRVRERKPILVIFSNVRTKIEGNGIVVQRPRFSFGHCCPYWGPPGPNLLDSIPYPAAWFVSHIGSGSGLSGPTHLKLLFSRKM